MSTSIQPAAQRLAALTVVDGIVKVQKATARAALLAALVEQGIERVRVQLPGGTPLATVGLTAGRRAVRVVDERAFLDWVRLNAPTEIVEQVRGSYRAALLKTIEATGEIPDGVELSEGAPYPTVRLADGATAAVIEALRSGVVDVLSLPAVEGEAGND